MYNTVEEIHQSISTSVPEIAHFADSSSQESHRIVCYLFAPDIYGLWAISHNH